MTVKMAKDNCNHAGRPGEDFPDGNNSDTEEINEEDAQDIEQIVQECSNEYKDLNNTLDQLDTWMTNIENQNDSLYNRMEELLQSNKQIRQEIQEERQQEQSDSNSQSNSPSHQDQTGN